MQMTIKNSEMLMKLIQVLLFVALSESCIAQSGIHINQVGYYPEAAKYAVVSNPGEDIDFSLVNTETKQIVFSGKLSEPVLSKFSNTITRIADFSSLSKAGTYILVNGRGQSYPVNITPAAFSGLSKAAIKSYYYHRVSMPLKAPFAGLWSRPGGHPDDRVLIHPSAASDKRPAGTVVSSPGGWYDAGDYNKYIVNSGITMGTLLSAYEDFPAYYKKLHLNIPESGNDIPDILDEILYNLRWMLTMQDPADGGVYHKCTNAKFDGIVMPGVTKEPRYLVQKSTAATLDFAAVMAQASRVYAGFSKQLPGLADSCLKAARSAWGWAENNPAVLYRQDEMNKTFSPAITTGAYGDRELSDEWFWAAVELSVTTGNTRYLENENVKTEVTPNIPSWNKVDMMGYYTALKHRSAFAGSRLNTGRLLDTLITYSNRLLEGGNPAFRTVMGQSARDFIWGSNSVAMNQSMLLIHTFLLTREEKYLHAAASNLDYVLGRNATGYCFVTGSGTRSPMHIHHRPSAADGIGLPVPGYLAGGPNPGRQDKCEYPHTETETSYVDSYCSYASNEIAINWNAPLVYAIGALEDNHQP
ncbi:MAG: glycoside hydrolase family 9 protein [Chitinophagaceae bacterium]|nr:glycoside hydrolase family 9 protein [Chitinophagaceae bacterium]MCW5928391.1 glycoside hydrolase family 9 protein [Chitinophagaceae bacterium]